MGRVIQVGNFVGVQALLKEERRAKAQELAKVEDLRDALSIDYGDERSESGVPLEEMAAKWRSIFEVPKGRPRATSAPVSNITIHRPEPEALPPLMNEDICGEAGNHFRIHDTRETGSNFISKDQASEAQLVKWEARKAKAEELGVDPSTGRTAASTTL